MTPAKNPNTTLASSQDDSSARPADDSTSAPASPWLRDHQRDARDAALTAYGSGHTRALVTMACGTGKTRVGADCAHQLSRQHPHPHHTRDPNRAPGDPHGDASARLGGPDAFRVLVALPSLDLIAQTLREWRRHPELRFDAVIVCSDATLGDTPDQLTGHRPSWTDAEVPVTTDPDRIARLLARGPRDVGVQVVLATYHSLDALVTAMRRTPHPVTFDLAIADEAHHLARRASETFTRFLHDQHIAARRRLFLTATPITCDPPGISMDNTDLFGRCTYRLTFAEAINAGLLCDYEIHVIAAHPHHDGPSVPDLEDPHAVSKHPRSRSLDPATGTPQALDRELAALTAIRAAAATTGARTTVSFHGRVRSAERLVGLLNQAGPLTDARTVIARTVSADQPAAERATTLELLAAPDPDALTVIANARCLGEGVDLPALDAVAFATPKTSRVDITQAVGRVLRTSPAKTRGIIIVPVTIPTHSSTHGTGTVAELEPEDVDDAVWAAQFGHVWSTLAALRDLDDRPSGVQESDPLTTARNPSTRNQTQGLRHTPTIVWDLPGRWADAARSRSVETTRTPWERRYELLVTWAEQHGHANPGPRVTVTTPDGTSFALGAWVTRQRTAGRHHLLPTYQHQALSELPGWTWGSHRLDTPALTARLHELAITHGTLDLATASTHKISSTRTLGTFAADLRIRHRAGLLTAAETTACERIPGWTWHPHHPDDEAALSALEEFIAWEKHAHPTPDHHEGGVALGQWVAAARIRHLAGTLPAAVHDEIAALSPGRHTDAAFTYATHQTRFTLAVTALAQYADTHGHLRLPDQHTVTVHGVQIALAQWVAARRHEHRRGALDPDRAATLEAIPGWTWAAPRAPRRRTPLGATRHGTRTGYVKGCRCTECTAANLRYNTEREQKKAAGQATTTKVDAQDVLTHIEHLLAAGWTRRGIVRAAGISRSAFTKLLAGTSTRVTPQTREKLLALPATHAAATAAAGNTDGALVDAAPIWSHLECLLGSGWTRQQLARHLGATGPEPALQISRTRVTAVTARKVERLHQQQCTGHHHASAQRRAAG